MPRCPAESDGLQHRGEADGARCRMRLAERAHCSELRLRHAALRELTAHRDLVRREMRGLAADAGKPERLRDSGDDGHRPVGCECEHAVDGVPAADVRHRVDVGEVDDLGDVCDREPGRGAVCIDGDDARSQLLHPRDPAALVSARADEEDGFHAPSLLRRA